MTLQGGVGSLESISLSFVVTGAMRQRTGKANTTEEVRSALETFSVWKRSICSAQDRTRDDRREEDVGADNMKEGQSGALESTDSGIGRDTIGGGRSGANDPKSIALHPVGSKRKAVKAEEKRENRMVWSRGKLAQKGKNPCKWEGTLGSVRRLCTRRK